MGGGRYGIKIDFYVGPKGGILAGKYRYWIGVNKRERLLKKAKDPALRNAINQMYRPGAFIGDGSTASSIIFEKRTGEHVSRTVDGHYKKAVGFRKNLINKVLKSNLSKGDRKIARNILKRLNKAILEWEG